VNVAPDRVDEPAARATGVPESRAHLKAPREAHDAQARAAVVARATVTEPREIGTALTRRPAPPKPKPVLTFAELVTIAWLRSPKNAPARTVTACSSPRTAKGAATDMSIDTFEDGE
jgi:hypothetical protein